MALSREIGMCQCLRMNVGPDSQGRPVMVKVSSGSCSVHALNADPAPAQADGDGERV
jgi:hypothetical protein